jgi:Xaa-Pro aminopeptidase
LLPGLSFLGESDNSVTRRAMATKDDGEVDHIRKMGRATVEVVEKTADFLSSHHAVGGVLVKGDGDSLTIGEVKCMINVWLAERGAENPGGTIFAAGRDAAVPHSAGQDDAPVPIGQTIVFDIFPCEAGGGYYYDFTRTWCLGYATDEALALYEDVRTVYREIVNELEPGAGCALYQDRTCDLFEARGHPTIRSAPDSDEGYVHSLGHGLGLFVHELPRFGINATEQDVLDPGVVFTIEPGLYYPDRAMGVRLEDTYYARPDGKFEKLADYPMELILPVG